MRILHIEDDKPVASAVELILKSNGFNPYSIDLGEEGYDLARMYDYDCVLLDLDLPDMSGFDVLRKLRANNVNTPVIVVSGRVAVEDKTRAFELGADDYVVKPFYNAELLARIRAVVRRSKGVPASRVRIGNTEIDLDGRFVRVDDKHCHLTAKEYGMLEAMVLRRGTTVTKEMFLNHLYGGMDEPELKIIDVFICKLRKRLADAGSNLAIKTIWGRGFVVEKDAVAA
jgi:two-component system cell cycle response regulator CtrA